MPLIDFYTADSFVKAHDNEITAVATVVLAFVLAELANRALARSLRPGSAVADTRMRLIRRLVFATIIVLGVGLALAQFPAVKRVATGILASSAVLGLVVGFAARQTLANAIAGVLLAITQPIRIGDLVCFEDSVGVVEDMKLTYTYIRLDDGRRLVVPNERLATSSVTNYTILDPRVQVEVSVWVPPGADLERALGLLSDEQGVETSVAEADKEAVRLSATTWAENAAHRGQVAGELRRRWLNRLREEGLFSAEAS
jgi:small-conductance mechanosensitive channel